MSYTDDERVQIARYMCWPPRTINPNYQSLVTNTQSTSEGGTQSSSSLEVQIRGYLTRLATLEGQIDNLGDQMQADSIGTLRVDPVRAMLALHLRGRRLVNNIATAIDATPLGDAFGPPSTVPR